MAGSILSCLHLFICLFLCSFLRSFLHCFLPLFLFPSFVPSFVFSFLFLCTSSCCVLGSPCPCRYICKIHLPMLLFRSCTPWFRGRASRESATHQLDYPSYLQAYDIHISLPSHQWADISIDIYWSSGASLCALVSMKFSNLNLDSRLHGKYFMDWATHNLMI